MKTLLKLLFSIGMLFSFEKGSAQIFSSRSMGDSLMDLGQFDSAIVEYKKVIASNTKKDLFFKDVYWYNLACSYALSGQLDSSISALKMSKDIERYTGFMNDIDLQNLHTHKEWPNLLAKQKLYFYAKNKNLPCLDFAYSLMLMKSSDQGIRSNIHNKRNEPLAQYYYAQQDSIDSANVVGLILIIDEIGWPSIEMVGRDASNAAFLILQHANLQVQKKYFPLVEMAYKNNKIRASNYAFLVDRIALFEGRLQVYGTQIDLYHGDPKPHPVIDPGNLNKRRLAMGMETIEEYMEQYKLTR